MKIVQLTGLFWMFWVVSSCAVVKDYERQESSHRDTGAEVKENEATESVQSESRNGRKAMESTESTIKENGSRELAQPNAESLCLHDCVIDDVDGWIWAEESDECIEVSGRSDRVYHSKETCLEDHMNKSDG